MTILDLFERNVQKKPNNICITDEKSNITYNELHQLSNRIASSLLPINKIRRPVAILLERSHKIAVSILGIIYSGNFYDCLDENSSNDRLSKIINDINPIAIITDNDNLNKVLSITNGDLPILFYENCIQHEIDNTKLSLIRNQMISIDPLCLISTSGSTGFPKSVTLSHDNIITYTSWFIDTFNISENTIFGSQTPFYFSMSLSDFYATLITGSKYVIIPKSYFMFVGNLMPYINNNNVNTLYWVPSAYGIITKYKLLDEENFTNLKTALFAGEEMKISYLSYFNKHNPNTLYANLYGPTETTDICCYHIITENIDEMKNVPMGKPCNNCRAYIIDENGNETLSGELLISSSYLALGYYNDITKTNEKFIQNPLNKSYKELLYKTGDLVKYENDILIYMGRIDNQIKRMGYRIELGEIENSLMDDRIQIACALYVNNKIVLVYEGKKDKLEEYVVTKAKKVLPTYMLPDKYMAISSMPLNSNGKIDRNKLTERILKQ